MYCARFTLESQGLLWPEAINTITKLVTRSTHRGRLDPYTAWHGEDVRPNRILDYLQPFGRIAYITDRTKIKAKADVRASKCVFVGYATITPVTRTYKFYNPTTKHTILSRDVHQWMEWHGRITATDDLALFDELDRLKTDSVILPATSTDIPILSDTDGSDLDDLWDLRPRRPPARGYRTTS
ncbi:Pentatricopeptide repeat-containing protein [Fragilaria crotonensis]|nr:Pentatricopeptide repeat-containing protein [Fragilaria crotonensis]